MRTKEEIEEFVKESMGERCKPLFSYPIFERILNSFYDFIYFKKLNLEYREVYQAFLEDLQEWEYIKSNFIFEKPIDFNTEDRLKDMFLREKKLLKAQL